MRYQLNLVFLLLIFVASPVTGQQQEQREDNCYVIVPSEEVLLVIASQSGAPIRFEDATLLMSVDGRQLAVSYNLYNSGAKAIRHLTPVMWTSFDTGGTLAGPGSLSGVTADELIMPGQKTKEEHPNRIVPLTAELREKLKLRGAMRAMVVLMVKNITFADGTTYSDEATLKAVQSYFEDLANKISRLDSLERQRR
jgi:hypothetical protein